MPSGYKGGTLFEQSFLAGKGSTQRPLSLVLGFVVELAGLCILLALSFLSPSIARIPELRKIPIEFPRVMRPEKPVPQPTEPVEPTRKRVRVFPPIDTRPVVPKQVPKIILSEDEPPRINVAGKNTAPDVVLCAVVACGGGLNEAPFGKPTTSVSPPPTASTPTVKPAVNLAPIRVGGKVQSGKLRHEVTPIYPELAKRGRVEGTVQLEATITRQGTIRDLHVVRGPALLQQSALQAVARWSYEPTLLNGEPVEVITMIDVTFTLSR